MFTPDDLPVVEAHSHQLGFIVEVVELLARALVGFAGQIIQLVVAIQVHLEVLAAEVGALEQALLDVGVTHGRQQGREPVQA
ncbi:hypothetical protein D3C76_1608040 [compost metagenome]